MNHRSTAWAAVWSTGSVQPWTARTGLLFLGAALLAACSSPSHVAVRFCKKHTRQEMNDAYQMLAARDKTEVSQKDYDAYEWDQESFDVHILRSSDKCDAAVVVPGEMSALAVLNLKSLLHDRIFSCLLPLVKDPDGWRVSRHFDPAENLIQTLDKQRKDLTAKIQGAADAKDEAYKKAVGDAFTAYWQAVGAAKAALTEAIGGAQTSAFCEASLNPDHGRNLAYDYLAFQEQDSVEKRPKHLREMVARDQSLIDVLRKSPMPQTTTHQNGLRLDVMDASLVDDQIRSLALLWGPYEAPFSWRLYVYSKDQLTHEGTGTDPDLILDASRYVADAPNVQMLLIEFPKMPAGTDKLEVLLVGGKGEKEYTIQIPIKPEFLKDAQ